MDVIETRIDTSSDQFKKNKDEMEALVADLNRELDRAWNERSGKSLERLRDSGKLPAKRKLELLLDRNTPFLEICPLAAKDKYDGKIHKAGLIMGVGVVEGKEVAISINDATIKGGSAYPLTIKKMLRGQTMVMENRLPCIHLLDSAGAYLPLQPKAANGSAALCRMATGSIPRRACRSTRERRSS